jgi:hypothetical protein
MIFATQGRLSSLPCIQILTKLLSAEVVGHIGKAGHDFLAVF